MQYLRDKDLGFDKENILVFSLQGQESREQYPVMREKLLQNPNIVSVGTATTTPGGGFGKNVMNMEKSDGTMEQYGVDVYFVDFDYFPTLGVDVVEGRKFSREYSTDSTLSCLVNQAMVRRMGWESPIGKKVQFGGNDTLPVARVIGVVNDFHQASLYDPIEALLFRPRFSNGQVHVRINPTNVGELSQVIRSVEQEWRTVFPNRPFRI